MIAGELSYEVTSPTIDSQIVTLKASGANIFLAAATTKFAAIAIRKIAELKWDATRFLAAGAIGSLRSAVDPEIARGVISMSFYADPADPALAEKEDTREYFEMMRRFAPSDNPKDMAAVLGYLVAQLGVQIFTKAGDDLTRANILRVATNLDHPKVKMLLDGVQIRTSPTNYLPITTARLVQFDGTSWKPVGPAIEVTPN